MLWLYAMHTRESKPRLLQGDGFRASLEYGSYGTHFTQRTCYRAR
jgi:hypothetical protein